MRDKILIVDDVEINREMLASILQDDYGILMACDGQEAIDIVKKKHREIGVVLLDLVMPNVDGIGVLEFFINNAGYQKIPVLIVSSEKDDAIEEKCYKLGAIDFIEKPYKINRIRNRVKNAVELYNYKNELEEKVAIQTETLKRQYAFLQKQAAKLNEQASSLKVINNNIIEILGTVVENRNLESGEHVNRVKGFTKILATKAMELYPEYKLTLELVDIIVSASALHDIGKICIPDSILMKPGKLTDKEFSYMKSHTTRGCEILENIEGVWDEQYAKFSYEICRHHHERYDGKGYPDGLSGEEIPISAQLVSIADVYDALVSRRVYKDAFGHEEAFRMIINGDCGVFSPKLLACFREAKDEFQTLAMSNAGN